MESILVRKVVIKFILMSIQITKMIFNAKEKESGCNPYKIYMKFNHKFFLPIKFDFSIFLQFYLHFLVELLLFSLSTFLSNIFKKRFNTSSCFFNNNFKELKL